MRMEIRQLKKDDLDQFSKNNFVEIVTNTFTQNTFGMKTIFYKQIMLPINTGAFVGIVVIGDVDGIEVTGEIVGSDVIGAILGEVDGDIEGAELMNISKKNKYTLYIYTHIHTSKCLILQHFNSICPPGKLSHEFQFHLLLFHFQSNSDRLQPT